MYHSPSYSPALWGDVPWWAFAANTFDNCSRADTSIKQLPEHQGQTTRDGSPACFVAWGGGLCCAGESIPSFKTWNILDLGYRIFCVTWEDFFLITVSEMLSAGEPRSAALRIMKPLTFLFQPLKQEIFGRTHDIQGRRNIERLVQPWVCSLPKLHCRRIKGTERSWFLLLLHCFFCIKKQSLSKWQCTRIHGAWGSSADFSF